MASANSPMRSVSGAVDAPLPAGGGVCRPRMSGRSAFSPSVCLLGGFSAGFWCPRRVVGGMLMNYAESLDFPIGRAYARRLEEACASARGFGERGKEGGAFPRQFFRYLGKVDHHMSTEMKLSQKIKTLREAHNLSVAELAERCACDVSVIEGLEAGTLPASLAPLIKITRALGVRLGPLMDDDENLGPVYIDADQMEEVNRVKSLATSSDAGDLSYFSLAAGRPSRHMDPFVITVTPSGETDHKLVSHEGEEWLYGMEGCIEIEYGKDIYVLHPGESIYYDSIVPHQVRAHDNQNAKFLAVVYTPM